MGADQLPLPHLGPQARVLLDRIVASGNAGVDRRDTHDWLLSRLIDLRYVEEHPLDTSVFVSTLAGRHRWQLEMLADEQREAMALRRQLIRYRLDERVSNMQIGPSTALAIAYPSMTPRLHGGAVSSGPRRMTTLLKPALAALFAASAVALVVFLGDTEPQDVRNWLALPPMHAVAMRHEQPKAIAQVTAPTAQPVAVAPARAATRLNGIISRAERIAAVLHRSLAKVEQAAPDDSAIASAVVRYDAAIRDTVLIAAAAVDAAASRTGRFAADLAARAEGSLRPIAAALLHAAETPVVVPAAVAQQPPADVPAPVAATPAPEQMAATPQPAVAPRPLPVAVVRAAPIERAIARAPAPPASDPLVDPQHAAVERLNALSLAAAVRGDVWRPNSPRVVAQTERPPWR